MSAPRCGSPATCGEFGQEHPHADDVVSAPARSCPSWCTRKHDDLLTSHATTRDMADGDTWVSLLMGRDGSLHIIVSNHQVGKGSEAVMTDLGEAPHLAAVLARLGHEDLAAAIRELLALAGGDPR